MLPARRPSDRQLGACQCVVLPRSLFPVGRDERLAIEVPLVLDSASAVVMTCAETEQSAIAYFHSDVCALQRIRVVVVDSLSSGIELIAKDVVVEWTSNSRQVQISVRGKQISAIGAQGQLRGARASGGGKHLYHAGHGV